MRTFGFGAFFQDDFRVMPKLTLNLGLRYDFYSNFRSVGKAGTAAAGLHNPSSLSMDGAFKVPKREAKGLSGALQSVSDHRMLRLVGLQIDF